jgi:hypothetical protein
MRRGRRAGADDVRIGYRTENYRAICYGLQRSLRCHGRNCGDMRYTLLNEIIHYERQRRYISLSVSLENRH